MLYIIFAQRLKLVSVNTSKVSVTSVNYVHERD